MSRPNIEAPLLRVAMIWNGAVQAEKTFVGPCSVKVGSDRHAAFPLPNGAIAEDSWVLLDPEKDNTYKLRLTQGMGGYVWTHRRKSDVRDLVARQASVTIEESDSGLITLGSTSFFFDHVKPSRPPKKYFLSVNGASIGSFWLSAFLHAALLTLFFLARAEMPEPDPLELPTSLITKYMVVPPPDDILTALKKKAGEQLKNAGAETKKDTGGKKQKEPEGKVGHKDAKAETTEIEGEVKTEVAAKVRKVGLLGAISSGSEGNALAAALNVPDVGKLVGGMNAKQTIVGRGSSGFGLRGAGGGGGGKGQGSLFGAGNLGTGVGAGKGAGLGKGTEGAGTTGKGRGEVAVNVQTGQGKTNGFLSEDQVRRVVLAHQSAIKYCYEVEVQRQPKLRGRIEATWRVALDGSVSTVRVSSSTLQNASVEGCITRQIKRWQFPKPDGGECLVTFPFLFGLQGGGQ